MIMSNITYIKKFDEKKLMGLSNEIKKNSEINMAQTLLILSREEVPHDTGLLQISGFFLKIALGIL